MGDLLQYKMTKAAPMLYPTVITPRAFGVSPKPDAKKSFSISFVLEPDHPDVAGMKKQLMDAAKAKWPGLNIGEEVKAGRLRMPFTSGDRMIERRNKKRVAAAKEPDTALDFLKGKLVFRASSDFPVALAVTVNGQGLVDLTEDNKALHKEAFYSGAMGLGGFSYRPYDAIKEDDKAGVKAYLDMVVSFNKGTRLTTGTRSASESFKGIVGNVVDENPTTELADELDAL